MVLVTTDKNQRRHTGEHQQRDRQAQVVLAEKHQLGGYPNVGITSR
jgi:hypothetical protein